MAKKKYEVTERIPFSGTRILRYEIEAKNAKEALEKVMEGDVEPVSITEDDGDDDGESEYEVEKI